MREVTCAPLRRVPAAIVDERTELSGGGDDTRATTRHFVTIELEDGRRVECRAPGKVAGLVTAGDLGVAYLKSRLLVDFQRLRL